MNLSSQLSRPEWLMINMMFLLFCSGCAGNREVSTSVENAQRQIDRGVLCLKLGDVQRAKAHFTLALEFAPVAAAVDGLGAAAFLEGDLEEAGRLFERAFSMDAGHAASLTNLGIFHEAMGDADEAEVWYMRALRKNPGDYRARNNLAALQYDRNSDPETVQEMLMQAQALSLHPVIEHNIDVIRSVRDKSGEMTKGQ